MSATTRSRVVIYTDGGAKPNPGPGAWAAIMKTGPHERVITGGERDTTNNRMELTAVAKALECLTRPCDVTVVTDSEYLANAFRKNWMAGWKRNGWKTASKEPVKNQDLWMLLDSLVSTHHVKWEWTKGHAGHDENERCDELATQTRRKLFGN